MTPIWCGIPVFNNAGTIADIVRRCKAQIANIVVVDDGSTDADLRELLRPLNVEVIRHPENRGKGAALLTVFEFAAKRGAEYLITLDGDGQHFPEDIPKFLADLSPDTIVIGSREEVVGTMPGSSRFGREFSDFWICVESGANARDTQSGFRVYPLECVMKLPLVSRRYNFEVEIVTRAAWSGMKIGSVPIRVEYSAATIAASSFEPVLDNARISMMHTLLVMRQLLPIPHRRMNSPSPGTPGEGWGGGRMPVGSGSPLPNPPPEYQGMGKSLLSENSSPLGLAASVAVSALLGILLWPWGIFAVAYVAIRLHLNKVVAAATLLLCAPKSLPQFCLWVGRSMASPNWARFVGAHVVAFVAAPLAAIIVYMVASRVRQERRA